MATILIDDPRLEDWFVKLMEDTGELVRETNPEAYARLGIAANLAMGRLTAHWKDEKGVFNFSLVGLTPRRPEGEA